MSYIEVTDEILSLLRDQQACAVLSNALTLHVERCKRRLQRSTTHKAKIRWAQEFKIAYEMRPGLLRKAQEAKSELESKVCRVASGVSDRMERSDRRARLKALGNSVSPIVSAAAWVELWRRIR